MKRRNGPAFVPFETASLASSLERISRTLMKLAKNVEWKAW